MRKLFIVLAALLIATNVHAAALLGAISQGNPPGPSGGSGTAPVVASKACTVSSGFTNGQLVQQVHGAGSCSYSATCAGVACSGANAITNWAITSQSSASAFAITSTVGAGELTGGTNAANVTTGGYTVTVTATNSTGTSPGVTQNITAYPDGSVAATAGNLQHTNFFTGYTGINYGSNRPPWNAAGVDYAVGYAGALSDPTTATLPSCASYANNVMTINSAPCTLSSYDYSLHNGICVSIPGSITNGGLVTLTNSHFAFGPSCIPNGTGLVNISAGATVNLTVTYSYFDGTYAFSSTCPPGCPSGFINVQGGTTSTVTLEYNGFYKTLEADVEHNGNGTLIDQYNYGEGVGISPNHGDWIASNTSSGSVVFNESFNTVYSGTESFATTFCYITTFTPASISGHCNNDTYVSNAACPDCISFLFEIDPGVINAITFNNNWLDDSGSFGYFAVQPVNTFNGPSTCSGNKALGTGAAITGTFSTYQAGLVCN